MTKKIGDLVPLVDVNSKAKDSSIFAQLTPPNRMSGEPFGEPFTHWLEQEGGKDYLKINPYSKEGLKEILKINDIIENEDDDFWNKPMIDCYWEILKQVQNKGRFNDWTISAREGFHRITGSVVRTLACTLNNSCNIVPKTISKENLIFLNEENKIDVTELRQKIIDFTFDEEANKVVAFTGLYFNKGGLKGCEASFHLKTTSYVESKNKLDSIFRSPFEKIGSYLSDVIKSITFDQVTYRVDFPMQNPTNLHKTKSAYNQNVPVDDTDFNDIYPIGEFIKSADYQQYIKDPFDKETQANVIKQFSYAPLDNKFHLPSDSPFLPTSTGTPPPEKFLFHFFQVCHQIALMSKTISMKNQDSTQILPTLSSLFQLFSLTSIRLL